MRPPSGYLEKANDCNVPTLFCPFGEHLTILFICKPGAFVLFA